MNGNLMGLGGRFALDDYAHMGPWAIRVGNGLMNGHTKQEARGCWDENGKWELEDADSITFFDDDVVEPSGPYFQSSGLLVDVIWEDVFGPAHAFRRKVTVGDRKCVAFIFEDKANWESYCRVLDGKVWLRFCDHERKFGPRIERDIVNRMVTCGLGINGIGPMMNAMRIYLAPKKSRDVAMQMMEFRLGKHPEILKKAMFWLDSLDGKHVNTPVIQLP
jgi:hypothetical protein